MLHYENLMFLFCMKQLEAIHCHHSFICGTKICTAIAGHEYWLFNMQNLMWVLGFTMSLPSNDVVEGVRCFAGSELFALEPFRTICFYEQFKLDAKPLGIRSAEQDEGGNSHVGKGGACDGSAELLPLESWGRDAQILFIVWLRSAQRNIPLVPCLRDKWENMLMVILRNVSLRRTLHNGDKTADNVQEGQVTCQSCDVLRCAEMGIVHRFSPV